MMYRSILFVFVAGYIFSCSPKLATTSTSEDYDEDISSFRPAIDMEGENNAVSEVIDTKGPYVAPTHDINSEMASIMDSVVHHNKNKAYLTYTIQVYIGRSREEANQVREKVYRVLPDEKPALGYKQPSWKVTVGEYYDRVEAYKTLTTLKGVFPGAMLVPERKYIE
jgi:5-carboxymethyl-2-hydroxymuconate isomerase